MAIQKPLLISDIGYIEPHVHVRYNGYRKPHNVCNNGYIEKLLKSIKITT
jgi:hypothetical protein